ncbi:MAG TPA: DMT family protein [Phycisphaerales bacterium]|nr:DMT family protein [Phycisphaerales bacterium]
MSFFASPAGRVTTAVGLLVLSNVFMNLAWYGHLAWFKHKPATFATLALAVLVSWLLALPEYCLQVPANRVGHTTYGGPLSAAQLKVIQEAITLTVFTGVAVFVLKEKLRPTDAVAFVLVLAGVAVSVWGRGGGK